MWLAWVLFINFLRLHIKKMFKAYRDFILRYTAWLGNKQVTESTGKLTWNSHFPPMGQKSASEANILTSGNVILGTDSNCSRIAYNQTSFRTSKNSASPCFRHCCWVPASRTWVLPSFPYTVNEDAATSRQLTKVIWKCPEVTPLRGLYSLAGGQDTTAWQARCLKRG